MNQQTAINPDEQDVTVIMQAEGEQLPGADLITELEHIESDSYCFSDRFRLICYFATGGVGQIAKTKDLIFDRVVAVKSLNHLYKDDPQVIKSFLEECRLNARLDHPSIVPIYNMGKSKEGNWEVVMKLINGSTLTKFIKDAREAYGARKFTYDQEQKALYSRLEYFLKVCEVIQYCHSQNIVHGDLKPENIMVGQFGEVYVMDWGCARQAGTHPERIAGTPDYLPPEVFKEKTTTFLIDIYALGVILFELVTLRHGQDERSKMSTEDTVVEMSQWHIQHGLKISSEIRAVIKKATKPDPKQRYQTVAQLASDVRSFIYNTEVSAFPDNPFRKVVRTLYNNRIKSTLVISMLFVILLAFLFVALYRTKSVEQRYTSRMAELVKFQSFTDSLAVMVEKNFLLAQTQLIMFADNLAEYTNSRSPDKNAEYFTNAQYQSRDTSPPYSLESDFYAYPVALKQMVLIPSDKPPQRPLIDSAQFVHICHKVIASRFDSNKIVQDNFMRILTDNSLIQRLFVAWENQSGYSFPGTYDPPKFEAYKQCWNSPDNQGRDRQIYWSQTYQGALGTHRIICRYPMFNPDGSYLGTAGLELRLEAVLDALLDAHRADPIHKFYFVDFEGKKVTKITNEGIILPNDKNYFPDGTGTSEILQIADRLQQNSYNQFTARLNNVPHFVCGAELKIVNCIFVQLIETGVITHSHK